MSYTEELYIADHQCLEGELSEARKALRKSRELDKFFDTDVPDDITRAVSKSLEDSRFEIELIANENVISRACMEAAGVSVFCLGRSLANDFLDTMPVRFLEKLIKLKISRIKAKLKSFKPISWQIGKFLKVGVFKFLWMILGRNMLDYLQGVSPSNVECNQNYISHSTLQKQYNHETNHRKIATSISRYVDWRRRRNIQGTKCGALRRSADVHRKSYRSYVPSGHLVSVHSHIKKQQRKALPFKVAI